MDINTIYLSGPFNFDTAESTLKAACQSSRNLIALIRHEDTPCAEQKLWRSYARRAIRYLDGVVLLDESSKDYEDALKMRTQEIGHINQKADRMLSFLEGLDEEMVSTDTSPSEGFAKLLAPNKDNREPQTLAQKSFVSETFYGHEILVHKAHQALISPLPRDFINIWSRQQYQGHLGHIRLLQNMRLFTRIGINPLEIKPSHVLEFGPGVGGL